MELPFEVGQEVEAKFNQNGYRGAWFRCRIRAIKITRGESSCQLEYLDFPDEECTWTRPRLPDPTDKSLPCLGKKRRLIWMIRPTAPPVLRENEIGEDSLTGMAVIFDNIYKVGDVVDWWKDDVFWTSHIAEVYTSSKQVKLVLPRPPKGEGGDTAIVADMKDLRPACSWSWKYRWKLFHPKGCGGRQQEMKCGLPRARLVDLSQVPRTIDLQLECQDEDLDSLGDHTRSKPEDIQFVDKVQDQSLQLPEKENYQKIKEQKRLEDSGASPGRREEVVEVIRVDVSASHSDNSLAPSADNTSCEDPSGKIEQSQRAQKIGVCPIDPLSPDTDQEAPQKKGRRRNVRCTEFFCQSDSDQELKRPPLHHPGPSNFVEFPGVEGPKGANFQADSTLADPEAPTLTEIDSPSEEAIVNVGLAGKKSCVRSTEEENLLHGTQLETSKEPKGANLQADSTLADPEALTVTENDSASEEAIVNGQVAGKSSCGLGTEENLPHRIQLETSKESKGANSQADCTLADPDEMTLAEYFSTTRWIKPFTFKADNELMTEKSGNVESVEVLVEENSFSQSSLNGYGTHKMGKEVLKHDLLTLGADGESATVSEEKMSEYHVSRCEADEVGEKVPKDESLRILCEVSCVPVLEKDKSPNACFSVLGNFEKGDGALESRTCRLDAEVAGSTEGMQDDASVSSQSPGSGSNVRSCEMQQVAEPKSLSCQVEVIPEVAATAHLEMNSRSACISKEAEVVETLANGDLEVDLAIPFVPRNKLLLRQLSCRTVRKATHNNFWRKRPRVISGTVSSEWVKKRARKVMEPECNSKSCLSSLDDYQVNPDDCVQDTVPSSALPTPVRDRDSLSRGCSNWALQAEVVKMKEKEEVKVKAIDCELVVVLQVGNGKDEKVGAADQEHLRTVGGDEEAQQASQRAVALAGTFDEAVPMEVDTVNLDGSEIMEASNSSEELHPGVKLLPSGKWSMKAYADGKPVWLGQYPTMGAAIYMHDLLESGSCPLNQTTEPTKSTTSRKPEERFLSASGSSSVENATGIATNARIDKGSVPNFTSTAPKLFPANISRNEIVVKMESPVTAELTNGSVTGGETEWQVVAGVKEGNNNMVDPLSKETKATVPEGLPAPEEVIPVSTLEDMNVTNKDMSKSEFGLKNVSARADVREKLQVDFGEVMEGVLSPTDSLRCHERLDIISCPSDDAAMVDPLKVRSILDLVNMGAFKTPEEQAVARQASLALWKAVYCCPMNREEKMQGNNTPERLALVAKMYRYFETDGSSQKVCLRSGPCGGIPGEEIYIGHYNTLMEAHAACKAISRCQKVFKNSIVVEDVGSAIVSADCAPVDAALQADVKVVKVHNRDLCCVIEVPRSASETSGSHLPMSSSAVNSHIVESLSGQHQNAHKIISELQEDGVSLHGFASDLSVSRKVHTSPRGALSGLTCLNTIEASCSEKYPRRILEATRLASSIADTDAPTDASVSNPSNDRGLRTTKASSGASAGVWRPCIDGASQARFESVGTGDGEPSFQARAQSAHVLQSMASNVACIQPVLAAGAHAGFKNPTVISVATSTGTPLSQPLKCSSIQHIVDLDSEEALTADTTGTAKYLKTTPTSTMDLVILDNDEELRIDMTKGTADALDATPLTSTQDKIIFDDDEEDLIDVTTGTRKGLVAHPLTSNGLASGVSFRGPFASSNPGYVSSRSHPASRTDASQAIRPSMMSIELPTTSFLKAPLSTADTSNAQVVDRESLDALAAQMQRRSQPTDTSGAGMIGNFRDNQERISASNPPHLASAGDQQQQQANRLWSQFSGRLPLDTRGTAIGFPLSMCDQGGVAGGVNSTSVPENRVAAHFQKDNERGLYNCCMEQPIEAVHMDFVFVRALHCEKCNWLMHSDCAIRLKQLRLCKVVHENGQIHEHVIYTCRCQRTSPITLLVLARVRSMIQSLSIHRNNKAFPIVLTNLMDILLRLRKVLAPASSSLLKETYSLASKLLYDLSTSPGTINYAATCGLLDSAVKLVGAVERYHPFWPMTLPSSVGVAPRC